MRDRLEPAGSRTELTDAYAILGRVQGWKVLGWKVLGNRVRQLVAVALVVAATGATGCRPSLAAGDVSYLPDDTYRAPSGVLTAAPAATVEENTTIAVLVDNIRHTPPGATIRMVAYSFSARIVADALIEAAARGVHVQLVVDGRHSRNYFAANALIAALGTDRTASSFIVMTRRSARGTVSHCHQKTWMFSRTGASTFVVMVGSMNLSTLSTTGQYTDMYSFVDRRDVWRAFGRVFAQQVLDKPVADPAVTDRMHADTAYFFPGFTLETDPIARILSKVPATRTTRIQVAMHAWHQDRGWALADLLLKKLAGGAQVEVFEGIHDGNAIIAALRDAGAVIHPGRFANRVHIHQKLMVVQYYRNGVRHRFATTGSDNWGDTSFQRDDVVVKVNLQGSPDYRRYQQFFDELIQRGIDDGVA